MARRAENLVAKNVFISHRHTDDDQLDKLKNLLKEKGFQLRDSSIDSSKPNMAKNPDYIKSKILAPRIKWASTLVVLITSQTKESEWVNWEIEYAHAQERRIVGVYARGAADSDTPEAFQKYGDALVGWVGERLIDAIEGTLDKDKWEGPDGKSRKPHWAIDRFTCK